jgi:hypothetical protein
MDHRHRESNRKHKSVNKQTNHDLVFIEVLPLKLHDGLITHYLAYSIKGITFISHLWITNCLVLIPYYLNEHDLLSSSEWTCKSPLEPTQ